MHEFAQSRTVMETMIRGDDLEGLLGQAEHEPWGQPGGSRRDTTP
jgi:hypothetical protein